MAMARKSNKSKANSIGLEQIKSTLIVWWIAMLCLMGIGFISIINIQYEALSKKEITKLSQITVEEGKNYGDEDKPVKVSYYSTNINGSKYDFYTLDPTTEVTDEKVYSNKELVEDDGIISILKNAQYLPDSYSKEDKKSITQLALWIYKGYLEKSEKNAVLNSNIGSQVSSLVKKANEENYKQSSIVLSTNTPTITLSKDKKYYVSDLIKLSFSNEYTVVDYKIDLSNAPKGTKIIDENGKEVENNKKVKNFYLKIPEKNVKDSNKEFSIGVTVTTADYYAYAFRTLVNKSDEADVVLNDLQIRLNKTKNTISLYVPKETKQSLISQSTILGFLALCVTSAICGIVILIINIIQNQKEIRRRKRKKTRKTRK